MTENLTMDEVKAKIATLVSKRNFDTARALLLEFVTSRFGTNTADAVTMAECMKQAHVIDALDPPPAPIDLAPLNKILCLGRPIYVGDVHLPLDAYIRTLKRRIPTADSSCVK